MVGHKEHREHKEEGEKGFEERIKESLREQVEWLYPRLEYHLLANHLLANAKALVFAGTYFLTQSRGGAEEEKLGRRWLEKGLEIYRKELPEQVLSDGVHFERSPMYHSIILEDLLDCFELLRLRPEVERRMGWGWISHREHKEHRGMGEGMLRSEVEEDARLFKEYAGKMLGALKMLTGPDGKIAKFNDSTEGIAKTPEELFAFAESLGIHSQPQPSTSTSASGFVRQEAGAWTLLAKCGEIGPSYQPGHAHADTWSFELWKDGRKAIGDTGCSTYVPGPVRSYERSTAAHNTVVIDGQNSSEVWAAHRVARRAKVSGLKFQVSGPEVRGGYCDYRGFEVRRRFELTETGLKGMDEIRGAGEHCIEVRFHLPPGVAEKDVKIVCDGERRVEPCEFAAGWNRREAGRCVVYHQTVRLPAIFRWSVS